MLRQKVVPNEQGNQTADSGYYYYSNHLELDEQVQDIQPSAIPTTTTTTLTSTVENQQSQLREHQ